MNCVTWQGLADGVEARMGQREHDNENYWIYLADINGGMRD